MMPIVPSGTRTRWNLRPLGRVHSASTVPTGSGKRRDVFEAGCDAVDALFVEQQPIDERGRAAGSFRRLDVFGVGGKDLRRRRAQRFRRRDERRVLFVRRRNRQAGGCAAFAASPMPRISFGSLVRRCAPVCSSLFPRQRHVVPMDQRRAAFEAEDRGDLARTLAHDTPRVVRRIGDKAASEFPAVRRPVS